MTDTYKCQSYYDDNNILQDCTCGECGWNRTSGLQKHIDRFIQFSSNVHCEYCEDDHDICDGPRDQSYIDFYVFFVKSLKEYGDYRERQGVVKTMDKFDWSEYATYVAQSVEIYGNGHLAHILSTGFRKQLANQILEDKPTTKESNERD